MFHIDSILFAAALVVSSAAVAVKAWFGYKAVRYQEDTKRLGLSRRAAPPVEPNDRPGRDTTGA